MDNDIRCQVAERTPSVKTKVEFGVVDERGRTVGIKVSTWTEIWELQPEGVGYCYAFGTPGVKLMAYVQMTRGGEAYGASQRSKQFTTAAERDIVVAKAVADSRKRALKRYT